MLFVQRDTFANFFHDSEDFVNAFLSLAILEWSMKDVQVYVSDLYPKGPFWDIWNLAFGHSPYPSLTSFDMRTHFVNGQKGNACFRNLAINIIGPAAPITLISSDTPCKNTALVTAYADFIIRGMGLQQFTHYAQEFPSTTVHVIYMSRRASVVWPEKRFCNDTHSFFFVRFGTVLE